MNSGASRAFTVRFRPTEHERRSAVVQPRRFRWLFGALAVEMLVSGIFYAWQLANIALIEHRPLASGISLEGIALIGLNAIVGAGAAFSVFGLPRLAKPGAEIDVRIDDAGLWFGGEAPRVVPWRKVAMIRDTGSGIAFHLSPLAATMLVIPKRALADGGRALWSFLDDRLVGRYRLIRSPNAPRIIFPSKAA